MSSVKSTACGSLACGRPLKKIQMQRAMVAAAARDAITIPIIALAGILDDDGSVGVGVSRTESARTKNIIKSLKVPNFV